MALDYILSHRLSGYISILLAIIDMKKHKKQTDNHMPFSVLFFRILLLSMRPGEITIADHMSNAISHRHEKEHLTIIIYIIKRLRRNTSLG